MHTNDSMIRVRFRRAAVLSLWLLLILYALPNVACAGEAGYGGIHLPIVETDPETPTGMTELRITGSTGSGSCGSRSR